jgi:hypothetical protein
LEKSAAPATPEKIKTMEDITIGEMVSTLKPAQLWSVLAAVGTIIAGAFALGVKMHAIK